MNDLVSVDTRLQAVEDRLEIQALAARFSDAVNERNLDAFSELWATRKAIWEIGPPLSLRAEGVEAIVGMLRRLMELQRHFMQMTHSGVITVEGDRAVARFTMRERGRGEGTYYDNLAVYNDVLLKERGDWRFLERHYHYRFLDQAPFTGDAFPVGR